MPSIIPSYIYAIFASVIISGLIIGASGAITLNIKHEAEVKQLINIADYVRTKSTDIISHQPQESLSSTSYLNIPTSIGNQRYWIKLSSDSSKAWITAGFGTVITSSDKQLEIPFDAFASGEYVSGSGFALLKCDSDGSTTRLVLSGGQ